MRSSSSLKAPTNSHPRWKLTHLPTIAAYSGANYPCTRTWQAIENPHTSRRPCLKPAIRARKVSRASIALPYAASSGSTSRAKCCSDRRTACASLSSDAGTKISRSVPQARTAARRSHTSSAGPAMANRSMNSSSSCLAKARASPWCACWLPAAAWATPCLVDSESAIALSASEEKRANVATLPRTSSRARSRSGSTAMLI